MREKLKEIAKDTLKHSETINCKIESIYIPANQSISNESGSGKQIMLESLSNSTERTEKTKIYTVQKDVVYVIANSKGKTLVLNFASARNPGGGFLNGARAQEEALCRASNLYLFLKGQDKFYKNPLHFKSGMYDSDMIYSKNVQFFKDEKGDYLENPVHVDVVTSCAVNVNDLMNKNKGKLSGPQYKEIEVAMRTRIEKIFQLALENKIETLILGAFGCGVFKNNPRTVKRLFEETMRKPEYKNAFKEIVYAVYDKELCEIFKF